MNVFEEIRRKRLETNKPLSVLCKEKGIAYQRYNSWLRKNRASEIMTGHKIRVAVMVSVREIANLVSNGVTEIPVPMDSLLRSMAPEEKKLLAQYLGSLQIERLETTTIGGHGNA